MGDVCHVNHYDGSQMALHPSGMERPFSLEGLDRVQTWPLPSCIGLQMELFRIIIILDPNLDPFLNNSFGSGSNFDLEPILLAPCLVSVGKSEYGSMST